MIVAYLITFKDLLLLLLFLHLSNYNIKLC